MVSYSVPNRKAVSADLYVLACKLINAEARDWAIDAGLLDTTESLESHDEDLDDLVSSQVCASEIKLCTLRFTCPFNTADTLPVTCLLHF